GTFPSSNSEKANASKEFVQLSEASKNDNEIIRQVFLNNFTHINTPYVKDYSMPNGTWPNSILVARNGLVWTVGTKPHTLISFNPKQGKIISSYPIETDSRNERNQSNQGF